MSESDSCSDDVGSSDDSLTKPKKIVLNKKQKRRWLEAAKKVNTKKMTLAQAAKSYNIAKKSLQQFIINTGGGLKKKDSDVFTTDQEHLLTNHLIKCMTLYGITNNKLRSIIYEYANRLPDCTCPEEWEFRKMASISWFRSFMRRHYELKKLCTKRENTFICTMGCHKRSDGKAALKKLEAKILICKVYRYLQREIEYLQSCNDISLLVNVLRRTAEATGVCEQTVTSMLEEEQMTINSLFEGLPQKDNGVIDVDQSSCVNNEESSLSNVFNIEFNSKPVPVTERVIISFNDKNNTDNTSNNTVDKSNDNVQEENKHNDADVTAAHDSDDDNDDMKLQIDEKMEIDTDNLTQCSDLQRMQQDSAPIQSVKIEIIEDESDQADQECPGDDDELDQDSVVIGPFAKKARLRSRSREKELTNNEDINKETNCLNVEYNVQEELVREEDIKKEEQELKTEIEVDAETMYLNVDYNVKEEFVREEDIKEEEQELKTKGAVDAEKLEMTKFIRGQPLKTQTQKILYNIYIYFTNESKLFKKKENGYFQKVQKRVSDATAISKNTISKIINKTDEKGNPEFAIKGRSKKSLHLKLNQFDYSVIRNMVYEYHFKFKELPTMTSLKTKLIKSIKYEGSTATLRRILNDMGFRFRKIENNKHVLMEKHNIRLKRIRYLKEIKKFRNAGRNIVYMDEYCIDPKDIKKDAKNITKGDRVVLMHAGNEKGFITGAFMFQRCIDFKTDVNSDLFENWIRKYLIPNLPQNSVLVIDNAVYHNKLIVKPPNSYSTKPQMIAWLQKHNITYDPRLLKPELYNLIKNNKEKYSEFVIDRIMEENGHSVLRIPFYHPDFNPIENIWLQLKDDLIRRKVVMNYRNVKELVEEKVTKTGLDEWKIVCDRALQCENDYRVIEPNIDGLTESCVIDICSTSEDSESDRSDSAWRDVDSDSE